MRFRRSRDRPLPATAAGLVAACVIAVLSGGLAPAAAVARPAPAPPVLFGTGGWSWPSDATLDRLARHGLRTWRLTMAWTSPGQPSFEGYDSVMRAAAARHVEVLVTLTGCPPQVCPNGGPPASGAALDGFQAFVHAAVARYGHAGSAWAGHPGMTPVRYWQVLNEVNGSDQWPNPSPAGYATLLRRTAATIRSTDPHAKVVLAGLGEKMTIWLRTYLPALYRQPGFARSFDVAAPEGYTVHPRDIAHVLALTRRIMRRFGDARKPLFVTEMSWSSGGPPFPFTTSEAGQAARLRSSWRLLDACRARWRLRRVYWFSYNDPAVSLRSADYWGFHDGLLDPSGRAKPAWHVFLRFLQPRRAARAAGPCRLR